MSAAMEQVTENIGCTRDDLDTPAVCLDLDRMQSNIRTMAEACRQRGIQWRPHAKCHKSPVIARQLVREGAIGVTCAKLGEAEVMAESGIEDLLIANMIVGPKKIARLLDLCRIARPIVAVDDISQARPISEALATANLRTRVFIEVDIGLHRVGVSPGEPALRLAQQLADLPGLELAGILAYEGHLLTVEDQAEKATLIRQALDLAAETRQRIESSGIPCPIVSCGGTGSYAFTIQHPAVTELQAGGAIFMDAFYRERCRVEQLQFAVTILSTVVSRPAPDRAIIDAGRKTMSMEIHMPRVFGRDDIQVRRLSAEHGLLHLDSTARDVRIGDRLELIPGYVDLTANLHNAFHGFRGDRLEKMIPIAARGMVS